jgi:glutaminase
MRSAREVPARPPASFGLAAIDAEGDVAATGDSEAPFSIQSISKVFTLTLSLGKVGDRLWRRVGREPSGRESHRGVDCQNLRTASVSSSGHSSGRK